MSSVFRPGYLIGSRHSVAVRVSYRLAKIHQLAPLYEWSWEHGPAIGVITIYCCYATRDTAEIKTLEDG